MKCPSCASALADPVPQCPECKLTLQRLDAKFGIVPRNSRSLTDRSGRLTRPERKALREALRLFEKKFPQSLLSVFVIGLPAGSSVSEYAFWLANRGRSSPGPKTHGENFDFLLVIDVTSNAAALTAGYGFEPYLGEEDLQEVLNALENPVREGDLAAGIHACLEALIPKLRELSAESKKPELESAEV